MFDTINIGTSGLLTHAKGLRIVGNNLANVNTPGFKGSQLEFASLVEKGNAGAQALTNGANSSALGTGITSVGSAISFRAGLEQNTGNPLDLSINGNGFFTIERDGQLLYTRSGDFHVDQDGFLVNSSGNRVKGLDQNGSLVDINVDELARGFPKATSKVEFAGNLSTTVSSPPVDTTVSNIAVFDANGANHPLKLTIKNNGGGDYTVTATDPAGATVATHTLKFSAGFPTAATSSVAFDYKPSTGPAFAVTLDFSRNVTSLVQSTTLAVSGQDGHEAGTKTDHSIGADGEVTIHYSNGETARGGQLALADFKVESDLEPVGGSMFATRQDARVRYGIAGGEGYGSLVAGRREGSNVDMATEFSNLILMQRGYQASSHVISTANDMIQQLFDMKGR